MELGIKGPCYANLKRMPLMLAATVTQPFRSVWLYRGFVAGSVLREFQARYRNSLLGGLWSIINPLTQILVYTIIFSHFMQTKLPQIEGTFAYSLYICVGILTWGFFTDLTIRLLNMFVENATIMKKINFPRICLPAAVIATSLLNFGIIFGLFICFLVVAGSFPGIVIMALVPVYAVLLVFAFGLGLIVGTMNVFFRDIGQLYLIGLNFWFWLTPIVYPISILSEQIRFYLSFNPMVGLINAVQAIVVFRQLPDWFGLLPMLVIGLVLCVFGLRMFRHCAGDIVDEL